MKRAPEPLEAADRTQRPRASNQPGQAAQMRLRERAGGSRGAWRSRDPSLARRWPSGKRQSVNHSSGGRTRLASAPLVIPADGSPAQTQPPRVRPLGSPTDRRRRPGRTCGSRTCTGGPTCAGSPSPVPWTTGGWRPTRRWPPGQWSTCGGCPDRAWEVDDSEAGALDGGREPRAQVGRRSGVMVRARRALAVGAVAGWTNSWLPAALVGRGRKAVVSAVEK